MEERLDASSIRLVERKQFCWMSGYTNNFKPKWWSSPWFLHISHIMAGSGQAIRLDDRRAVVLLCPFAHDLHVANAQRLPKKKIGGVYYPTFDASHLLWIKRFFDKDYYDVKFLEEMWNHTLPHPTKPDSFWIELLRANKGLRL